MPKIKLYSCVPEIMCLKVLQRKEEKKNTKRAERKSVNLVFRVLFCIASFHSVFLISEMPHISSGLLHIYIKTNVKLLLNVLCGGEIQLRKPREDKL